jgi:PHD/YefM family antitoxin component YafN of YafNO toxin-antitoxin module
MTVRVSVKQLRDQLPHLLDETVNGGGACVVRRNGKDYAVIVGVGEWRRRTTGRRLDQLGPRYKFPRPTQARVEELLARQKAGRLTRAQRHELDGLLRQADEVMLRRAAAMGRVL